MGMKWLAAGFITIAMGLGFLAIVSRLAIVCFLMVCAVTTVAAGLFRRTLGGCRLLFFSIRKVGG